MKFGEKDPGIQELISYFDQPDIHPSEDGTTGGWDWLENHPRELAVVTAEIAKCRKDFSYAAKNYFVITNKEQQDIPFRLNEGQEIILSRLNEIKAQGKAQKLMILKARQLGCSTLIEGLLCWRTMFYPNSSGIIVSHNPDHSAYLFGLLQRIYDHCPWWLKPMWASRKIEEGLVFDNSDLKGRRVRPGLNSAISVQWANQSAGVGQGRRISCAHLSETGDWDDNDGRRIIEGDLGHALAENVHTFAVIESTAKGYGNYFHTLWKRNVELGDLAEWHPIFLPWFFEPNRRISLPSPQWEADPPEEEMRARVYRDWLRCSNRDCRRFLESHIGGIDLTDTDCKHCLIGKMLPYKLSDQQLAWMWQKRINAQKDEKSLKELRGEQCSTSDEAFQISGLQVFPGECLAFINSCIEDPIARGYLDRAGEFHGLDAKTGKCPAPGCNVDHRYEYNGKLPLHIWKYAEPGVKYVIGVDVAEGLGGKYDYSVAFVNRVGSIHQADEQVAIFRSNEIDPVAFAYPCANLGHMYNDAMLSVEVNKFDTTFSYIRNQCSYPNLYRWKNVDTTSQHSNWWGWLTSMKSKPRLWQTSVHWLRHRMWILKSKNILDEFSTFQKESAEDRGGEAADGAHDDEAMAGMIALYCSHDSDWDDNLGMIPLRTRSLGDPDSFAWRLVCGACGDQRGVENPNLHRMCLNCGSIRVHFEKNVNPNAMSPNLWEELESGSEDAREEQRANAEPEYELM